MDRPKQIFLGVMGCALWISTACGQEAVFDPSARIAGIPIEQPMDLYSIRLAAINNDRNMMVVRAEREEFGSTIDKAIARFDPVIGLGINGGGTDRQNRSIIQSFGASVLEQQTYSLLPGEERNQFYVRKRNTLGGQATIGFTTEYFDVDPAGPPVFFNPGWDSRLRFRYQQPLLRGAGKEFNTAAICIAQQQTNQTTYAFNAAVQKLLRDVEVAYWDWELAWNIRKLLESDQARSERLWNRERKSLRIGTGTVGSEAQARERFHRARIRRIQATSLARIGEQKLRQAAGQPAVDLTGWVPVDAAESTRPAPTLDQAIANSGSRPELRSQQAAIAAADAQIRIAENGLQPDFSMLFDYSILGLQERLDDSLTTIADLKFYEWAVGVQYEQSLYWRGEKADLRKAQWFATRQRRMYDQLLHMATHEVAQAYEQVKAAEAQIEVHRDRVAAAEKDVESSDALYRNRKGTLNAVIEAQDRLLEAQTDERITLAAHQRGISELMFASGLMMGSQIVIDDASVYGPEARYMSGHPPGDTDDDSDDEDSSEVDENDEDESLDDSQGN